MPIFASFRFQDAAHCNVPILNPRGWFGKTWLLELGGSYAPFLLIVEADTISDAIDVLSDDETYGHQIHVPDSDLPDYPEGDRHYDGSGRVIDTEHLMIYGQECCDLPFPVLYHGDTLPAEGMDPRQYASWALN